MLLQKPTSLRIELPSPGNKSVMLPTPGRNRYVWKLGGFHIIEGADPFHDEARGLKRKTPTGLTENELLSSLNYLDESALQVFDGIGPSIAGNIIETRKQQQYFAVLEDILAVKLIGKNRFEKLVGRAPSLNEYPLHTMMHRPLRQNITLEDLRPWKQPAPEIKEALLLNRKQARSYLNTYSSAEVLNFNISRWRLLIHCSKPTKSSRAKYVIKSLPKTLRKLNYEGSLPTTD
ncbi:MAG: helix-hairpin-helix domain-containing protein [Verrucomicrobiota bacterium]